MLNREKRWRISELISAKSDEELTGYSPIFRQILFNRGLKTHASAREYLAAEFTEDTDPDSLLGVPLAVERIQWAVQNGEKIAVYGDYDADGVTATALLTHLLTSHGADVQGYIPNRFDEGYGLNRDALDTLRESGVNLVITVDCGIRSIDEAEYAREIGLDLIISDHHHPGYEMPPALAIINPKQAGDRYIYKNLAGVGLAYKLASALQEPREADAEDYLDLVALGTVADLAPLNGENRALVRQGIKLLCQPHRQGILSLIHAAGINPGTITSSQIGYILGPRLNAAGRLDSALAALNLLMTSSPTEAGYLAQQLDNQNRERQRITQEIQVQAEEIAISDDPEGFILFAVHPNFNPGVVGLAASRLTERYYRPAIVGCQDKTHTRASCRSIDEFHITDALDQCAELLEHHGGHAAAAGFTVNNQNLPELIERLKYIAQKQLSELDLRRKLTADIEIPLSELKPYILQDIQWLEPTGNGNPQAVFVSRYLKVKQSRCVGRDQAHLKFDVTDGSITYSAIGFNLGYWLEQMPDRIDLMYRFETNEFNGQTSLQLNAIDLKPSGSPD